LGVEMVVHYGCLSKLHLCQFSYLSTYLPSLSKIDKRQQGLMVA